MHNSPKNSTEQWDTNNLLWSPMPIYHDIPTEYRLKIFSIITWKFPIEILWELSIRPIVYIFTRRQLQYLRLSTLAETAPLRPPNLVPKVPKNDVTGERRGSKERRRGCKRTMKRSMILTQRATLEGPASAIQWMKIFCHMIGHISLLIRSGMILSCCSADLYCMLCWCITTFIWSLSDYYLILSWRFVTVLWDYK